MFIGYICLWWWLHCFLISHTAWLAEGQHVCALIAHLKNNCVKINLRLCVKFDSTSYYRIFFDDTKNKLPSPSLT